MVFARQLPVRLLDVLHIRAAGDAQQLVVILATKKYWWVAVSVRACMRTSAANAGTYTLLHARTRLLCACHHAVSSGASRLAVANASQRSREAEATADALGGAARQLHARRQPVGRQRRVRQPVTTARTTCGGTQSDSVSSSFLGLRVLPRRNQRSPPSTRRSCGSVPVSASARARAVRGAGFSAVERKGGSTDRCRTRVGLRRTHINCRVRSESAKRFAVIRSEPKHAP